MSCFQCFAGALAKVQFARGDNKQLRLMVGKYFPLLN